MADSATATFGNTKLDGYYQSFLKTLPNEQISYDPVQYEEQTVDSITGQVEKYLRNYYDKAITQRQAQTVQNNAELDVDAASRGMGSSTFLSDMKNRQLMSESADIAGLNSDYNATLAQTVQDQYNQYLSNKLNVDFTNRQNQLTVDQWNASARLALEELAYQRALEAYQRKGSGGGSSGIQPTVQEETPLGGWWYDLNDNNQYQIYGNMENAIHDIQLKGTTTEGGRLVTSDGTYALPTFTAVTPVTGKKTSR